MGDRRVDLDRVDELEVRDGQRCDRPADRRDDADGERVLVAERAPDRRDRLADDDTAEWPSGTGCERMPGGSTRITPTSSKTSQPTIVAGTRS